MKIEVDEPPPVTYCVVVMQMKRDPGELPWILTLMCKGEDTEIEFYETENEADQAAATMIDSGVSDGSTIYISRVASQGHSQLTKRGMSRG